MIKKIMGNNLLNNYKNMMNNLNSFKFIFIYFNIKFDQKLNILEKAMKCKDNK